jgi:transmembrane sensor
MNAEEYMLLYEKYISGLCSEEEVKLLYNYQDNFKMLGNENQINDDQLNIRDEVYDRITKTIYQPTIKNIYHYTLFKAAAILFIAGSLSLFLFNYYHSFKEVQKITVLHKEKRKIKPGSSKATLILSDGSVIDLAQAKTGLISANEMTTIQKSEAGAIVYTSKTINAAPGLFNTVSVPRGGTYQVTLPDGTLVWLNSASSLTYPIQFTGKSRSVELKGEAYFEVTKNRSKPFIVNADEMKVEVLGTHFNMKAYANDKKAQTTLVEGSVRLSSHSAHVMLVPGDQGVVSIENAQIKIGKVNINKVMAWKNGYFLFKDDSVEEIMDQIGKWYDVDIVYKGDMSNKTFGGIYSRSKDLEELLKGLELTGLIHFKIEGRRIIVMA